MTRPDIERPFRAHQARTERSYSVHSNGKARTVKRGPKAAQTARKDLITAILLVIGLMISGALFATTI